MSSDARSLGSVSTTQKIKRNAFNLQRHDKLFQGAEHVVADATRLIDTARDDLHTAEGVEAQKLIEQIDPQDSRKQNASERQVFLGWEIEVFDFDPKCANQEPHAILEKLHEGAHYTEHCLKLPKSIQGRIYQVGML